MDIRRISILSDDAQTLIALLDQELCGEYAPEHWHPIDFEQFDRCGGVFVVAYESGIPVACGALRPVTPSEIELKRMFVIESCRGRGFSRRVLAFLEDTAGRLGYHRVVLETGDQQAAAIRLYVTSGYLRVPAFGEYVTSERSVCFAKEL